MSVKGDRSRGYTLVELMVAMAVMLLVVAGVTILVAQTGHVARVHWEWSECQQRARVAVDLMTRDLRAAGAGVYLGPATGPLTDTIPAVWPRRLGRGGDAPGAAHADVVTILSVPESLAQTRTSATVLPASVEIAVAPAVQCPAEQPACGFARGTTIGAFDAIGRLSVWSVDQVSQQTLFVRGLAAADQDLSAGSVLTELRVRGYRWDAGRRQLRYFDGDTTDQPVIDGVAALSFRWFDAYGELPVGQLNDGPWLGSGATMFDVDLLRIRRMHVAMTIEEGRTRCVTTVAVAMRNAGGA